ncbi:C6 finger domain-protein [Echria macrotheca]|uniref:C6 finger domain-protein n=1 Tax=Echria macrotheca TaxID=438768 RepID=A0AAJ0BCF4_9PEZI|nr:C6 finger domain-protein [Echria macrotheca]
MTDHPYMNGLTNMAYPQDSGSVSPTTRPVSNPFKPVAFHIVDEQKPDRKPLRVNIYPHDATDSIIATVKSFYGITGEGRGVSFEDEEGNILIARYENFRNHMTVTVRIMEDFLPIDSSPLRSTPAFAADRDESEYMPAGHHDRLDMRSPSPNSGRGRRSTSAGTNAAATKNGRSRSAKNRSQTNGGLQRDSVNGYSSGDGAPASASGRFRDQLGNTEISVANIVEGGRRKRPKFESSELPLFAPPQMPAAASNSSVSPARRPEHHRNSVPFAHSGQNPLNNWPIQSPQGYTNGTNGTNGYTHTGMYASPVADSRRTRGSFGYTNGSAMGPGVEPIPTPDPTVRSSVSEEDKDVAMQLVALGSGRPSNSTVDDMVSPVADGGSKDAVNSDVEEESDVEAPPSRRQRLDSFGTHRNIFNTTESHFVVPSESRESSTEEDYANRNRGSMAAPEIRSPKPRPHPLNGAKPRTQGTNRVRTSKPAKPRIKKEPATTGPMSPTSLPASRKPSVASNAISPTAPGEGEIDMSCKPRCQRCRKSKKGCDRQRPCGRCRDAGLPADQCISEDETNGRRGRFGRHMGVSIKTEEAAAKKAEASVQETLLPPAPIPVPSDMMPMSPGATDGSRKRKR